MVLIPMELGDPHLEPLTTENHLLLFGECYSVQMCGHDGICPEFHSAGVALQRKNIGDVSDVLVVPE